MRVLEAMFTLLLASIWCACAQRLTIEGNAGNILFTNGSAVHDIVFQRAGGKIELQGSLDVSGTITVAGGIPLQDQLDALTEGGGNTLPPCTPVFEDFEGAADGGGAGLPGSNDFSGTVFSGALTASGTTTAGTTIQGSGTNSVDGFSSQGKHIEMTSNGWIKIDLPALEADCEWSELLFMGISGDGNNGGLSGNTDILVTAESSSFRMDIGTFPYTLKSWTPVAVPLAILGNQTAVDWTLVIQQANAGGDVGIDEIRLR